MWNNAHDAYLDGRVLSAAPIELVNLLYQACNRNVRDARRALAVGDIRGRSAAISRAAAIVTELTTSLNHIDGGDLSRQLARLYDFMQRQLVDANVQQSDPPLVAVLGLLTTLGEAWETLGASSKPV